MTERSGAVKYRGATVWNHMVNSFVPRFGPQNMSQLYSGQGNPSGKITQWAKCCLENMSPKFDLQHPQEGIGGWLDPCWGARGVESGRPLKLAASPPRQPIHLKISVRPCLKSEVEID